MEEKELLKEFYLFTYSLSSFQQKQKVRILRGLIGYKNKKKKLYEHEGLIQMHGASKIAQNVILVPAERAVNFSVFFERSKVRYEYKSVWVKK